jgi:hypothetical protein
MYLNYEDNLLELYTEIITVCSDVYKQIHKFV